VPLVARGRTLGALSLASAARRYGPADLALAADLAGRAALAVDNARLYTEAHEALAARDRFLAVAAHELRTPVARLKAQAELLRRRQERGQLDAGRLAVGLVAIDDAANHFVRLTRDLLDVSRLRAGQLPLRHRPLDLAALARAVATREGTRLGLGDRLRLALPDDLPAIDADPDRLDQVLANLLENAAKYSPEGGAIEVALCAEGGGLLLRIRDSGIGLPPGMTETIFTPFERAANATARRIPGLGLGLSICRDIAVRHGGRLWAESAGEGQGTTMLLWLPASRECAEAAGPEAAD
jgi:signal transduction histidine kinase